MKKRIAIAGAFLLLVFAFSVFTIAAAEEKKPSKKVSKLMTKAQKAIQDKQTDLAIDLLQQVISLEPGHAVVRHNLAVLLHEKGQSDEAIANFEEALRLQPDYERAQHALRQALFEVGKAAMSMQKFEKSNEYLMKLRDLPYTFSGKENDNMLVLVRFYLGYNFFNLKQYPQAKENFELCQAMEGLEAKNLELYANATYFLGMIDYIGTQYQDSCQNFKKYLTLYEGMEKKPELFAQANYFVGANIFRILEADLAKGDVSRISESAAEILPYLNVAMESKLAIEDAYVMTGNCYVYLKEYDKAMAAYQQLCELFPQSTQLQSYQVFMKELQKMQQQAQKTKKKR